MLVRGTIKIWQDKIEDNFWIHMLCSIFQKLSFSFLVEGGTRTIPVPHSGHQHAKYSSCQADRTSGYLRVPLMLNTLDTSDISVW